MNARHLRNFLNREFEQNPDSDMWDLCPVCYDGDNEEYFSIDNFFIVQPDDEDASVVEPGTLVAEMY